jgi:two-component system phosphate regulon sensor histidine kinase PhoR
VKLRRVFPLVITFVFVPAALMLIVGILMLVYGSVARDYVFGVLILALVATTVAGTAATLAVLYREAQVAKLQTDFVNKVSHDLRTPLTSIRMFVETLQLGRIQDPARQSEALEIIAEETGGSRDSSTGSSTGRAWNPGSAATSSATRRSRPSWMPRSTRSSRSGSDIRRR